jgi:hypothetical protein
VIAGQTNDPAGRRGVRENRFADPALLQESDHCSLQIYGIPRGDCGGAEIQAADSMALTIVGADADVTDAMGSFCPALTSFVADVCVE